MLQAIESIIELKIYKENVFYLQEKIVNNSTIHLQDLVFGGKGQ